MQDKLRDIENTPTVADRRACPRLRVTSLVYIDIGNVNGGIVTSLSEKGLALAAADPLGNTELGDGPLRMRIQLPETPEAVEASGEIIWTSPSGKEARVRFVEIGDKTREQIRRWISDQVSSSEPRPDPPKLRKMRPQSARRAKARGPRFSFADVASSRVDAEGKTGVEGLPQITGEPSGLPPLRGGASMFCDGAEAVASVFESSAFRTEDRTGNTRSYGHEETAQAPSDQDIREQLPLSIPQRRQHPRKQVLLFTYAELGENNGGLVFNLGEGGLALTAAAALHEHHFSKMRVRFPDSADWFETCGRLAWKNDSGKEAGIEFQHLPEDARAKITEWVSQGDSGADASNKDNVRTNENNARELPSFMEPDLLSTEPIEIPASFEEQPFENQTFQEHGFVEQRRTPAASSSGLFETGIKGVFERASVKRRVAKIKPLRVQHHSAKPLTRVARKALSIAAGVAFALGSWMFFERSSLNESSGIIAHNLTNIRHFYEPRRVPGAGETSAGASETKDPRAQSKQTVATKTGTSVRSLEQIPTANPSKTGVTNGESGSERTSKEKPHTKNALKQMPIESSPPRTSDRVQRPAAPSQGEQKTESPQFPAPVPAPSSENKAAQINATPPSLGATLSQPAAAPPVELEKEKSPVAPKQPEPVLARTPVVAVSFDPFPSILMPKMEKSKKSHQGKSLQMGSLISRVDPVYPKEAKERGIEGTVRVHAIFNRDGAVQSVISVSGPPLLVPAAMNAVRQWRYSQTILGGQAMETEEDVTVLFRLANSADKN